MGPLKYSTQKRMQKKNLYFTKIVALSHIFSPETHYGPTDIQVVIM